MADAWPTAGKISGTAGQGLHSKAFKILAESRPCPGINGKHAAKAFQQQQIELQRKPRAAKEAKSPGFPAFPLQSSYSSCIFDRNCLKT